MEGWTHRVRTAQFVVVAVLAAALPLVASTSAARAQSACAPWCVLDLFDERSNGSLRTQGPWRTNQPGATDGAWATDAVPVTFSGKTMANQPDGTLHRSNAYAELGALAIAQGARGTLFFEVLTEDLATTDLSLGLSDDASPGLGFDGTGDPASFGDFEAQVTLRERGLVVRDGATSSTITNVAMASGRRYAVWLVVDNAADTYQVRVQPAGGQVVLAAVSGKTTFAFRNGTGAALRTYLNLNGGSPVPAATSYVDSLFVAPTSAATSYPAPAFEQVVDLDGYPTGAIGGRDGWTASSPGVAVITDPTDGANRVLEMTGPGLQAHRAVPGPQEGRRGTLFFRVRRAGGVDLSAGLSDVAAPSGFADFEAQANVQNTSVLNARDGGAFAPAGTLTNTAWQCVWLVADTAANRFELHVRGGEYPRRVQLPEDAAATFAFRNGMNAAALARLLLITGSTSPGRLLFDDFAVDADARNLRVPSGDPADCVGAGGDAPLDDPIPGEITKSGLGVRLTEFSTVPASSPAAPRARINFLGEVPRSSGSQPRRLFVPDLAGDLWFLTTAGAATRYLDVDATFPNFVDEPRLGTGFGFVAFHPQFAGNGRFYTVHTEAGAALTNRTPDLPGPPDPVVHGVVTEWTATDPAARTFAGTRREVLRVGFDQFLHGIQEVGFNPTAAPGEPDFGLLYVALGDGEENPNWSDGPQDLGVPQGKVLRVDPRGSNGAGGGYGIPAGNPFVGRAGALGEVYVLGLRNPHRFTWDDANGDLLISNIGEANIDGVYRAEPGDNYGWNIREGGFRFEKSDPFNVYPLPPDDQGFTYPVAAYDHDDGDAIAGGFVYRGTRVPALYGKYVFGDIVTGRVFYTEVAEMVRGGELATIRELRLFNPSGSEVSMTQLAGNSRVDLRLGADADGELFVLSKANGRIWRVDPAP